MGMIVAGLGLAVLGLAGALYRPLIGVMSLAAAFWGLGEVFRGWVKRAEEATMPEETSAAMIEGELTRRVGLRRLGGCLAGCCCLPSWRVWARSLGRLAPPTAGDALCYHLDLPKRFSDRTHAALPAVQRQLDVPAAGRNVVSLGSGDGQPGRGAIGPLGVGDPPGIGGRRVGPTDRGSRLGVDRRRGGRIDAGRE